MKAGKGGAYRPVDESKFEENYNNIFKKTKKSDIIDNDDTDTKEKEITDESDINRESI